MTTSAKATAARRFESLLGRLKGSQVETTAPVTTEDAGQVVTSDDTAPSHVPAQFTTVLADGALMHIRRLYAKQNAELAFGGRSRRRFGSAKSRASPDERASDSTPVATDLAHLAHLLKKDHTEEALALAAAQLSARSTDESFLGTARQLFHRTGAITLEAAAVEALRRVSDSASLQLTQRQLRGRLIETEPTWLPKAPKVSGFHSPSAQRVVHLLKVSAPYRQSGYTLRSQYLIDGQRAAGLDPVVISALGYPENLGVDTFPSVDFINSTPYYRLRAKGYDLVNGPFDEYLDAYATEASPLVAGLRPSLIHAHSGHRGYEPALVGLALAAAFGLPLVYEVRGFFESLWSRDPAWNERGELYWRRREAETRCMTEADAVVTLSETMRSEIIDRGVDPEKVFIVPNGVDPERFHPAPRDETLARALDLQDSFVFGYVSNLDHYREGQELLIKAVPHLAKRGINAKALIIGDGGRRSALEQTAADVGVADRVVFIGQVPHDQVLDYYHLLDVFVIPRVQERAARLVSPLKPFEAMAAGLPLVVSDIAALSELVGTDRGVTFPAGDSEGLANTLAVLYQDPERRSGYSNTARAWVLSERQWPTLAKRYEAVYEFAHTRTPKGKA